MDIQQLNRQFGIPGVLGFEAGKGGLPCARIESAGGIGEIYLQGAHVTSFRPAGGQDILFVSERSKFETGKAIRGGIPVIFPWFGAKSGDPAAGQHGLARTAEWRVEAAQKRADGAVVLTLTLTLRSDERTKKAWPFDVEARLSVSVGTALELSLAVRNQSAGKIEFEEALHTYLAVEDVSRVAIGGLEACEYIDKTAGFARKREGSAALRLTGETDRVYVNTPATCVIEDASAGRRIVIEKSGSASTVVWNPWEKKASEMADLGPDQWKRFVCLESGNIGENAARLSAGAEHLMGVKIRGE